MQYLPPLDIAWVSRRELVFTLSDIHMGNSRPTSDLSGRNASEVVKILNSIEGQLNPGQWEAFDLVFNGDTFDFWKAIPNPVPSEVSSPGHPGYRLDTIEDYEQRFREILAQNQWLPLMLARIIFRPDPFEMGCHVYILGGNHDDPADPQRFGPARFKRMLVGSIVTAALQQGLVPPTPQFMAIYQAEVERRLHWGRPMIYSNPQLAVHIEHGHRWDKNNQLRRDHGQVIYSEGQILVENFMNGLHDINLSKFFFGWLDLMRGMPGPAQRKLRDGLRWIDNFTSELGCRNYLSARFGGMAKIEEAINQDFALSQWQRDPSTWQQVLLLTLPEVAELLYKVFFRHDQVADLQNAAQTLMNQSGTKRIVVFGHSHIIDKVPVRQPAPQVVKRQYVNTGTFVDMAEFNPNTATKRRKISQPHFAIRIKPDPNAQAQGYPPGDYVRVDPWLGRSWGRFQTVKIR